MTDTSNEAVEQLADDLQMVRWPADQGCKMREDAAHALRALRDERNRVLAERGVVLLDAMRFQRERDKAEVERDRLREALRIIAGYQQCIDNLMSNVDVARAALGENKP